MSIKVSRNRLVKYFLAICLLACSLVVNISVASGKPPAPEEQLMQEIQKEIEADEAESLREDAEIYAKFHKVSIDEAISRLSLQESIGELNASLLEQMADSYAGLWIEHQPDYRVVVQFTADGMKQGKSAVANVAFDDFLVLQLADLSLVELDLIQENVQEAFRTQNMELESELDIKTNSVNTYVVSTNLRQAQSIVTQKVDAIEKINLIPVEQMGEDLEDIFGGFALTTCTSGFSVVHDTTRTRGVLTAGHCNNAQSFGTNPLVFKEERNRRNQDAQWHVTPGVFPNNKTVDGVGGPRRITATRDWASHVVGSFVCKFGMTTGRTCGTIISTTFLPGIRYQRTFIRLDDDSGFSPLGANGDSGGSVFIGNTALGLVKGRPGGDRNDLIYMPINFIDFFDVSVVTTSATELLNRDSPDGSGDWEIHSMFPANQVCTSPNAVLATSDVHGPVFPFGSHPEVYDYFNPTQGLRCDNFDQPDGACTDYSIIFNCP